MNGPNGGHDTILDLVRSAQVPNYSDVELESLARRHSELFDIAVALIVEYDTHEENTELTVPPVSYKDCAGFVSELTLARGRSSDDPNEGEGPIILGVFVLGPEGAEHFPLFIFDELRGLRNLQGSLCNHPQSNEAWRLLNGMRSDLKKAREEAVGSPPKLKLIDNRGGYL